VVNKLREAARREVPPPPSRTWRVTVTDSANYVEYELWDGSVVASLRSKTYRSAFQPTAVQAMAAFRALCRPCDTFTVEWRGSAMGSYPHTAAVRAEVETWIREHGGAV
jgi:hypothetical protein